MKVSFYLSVREYTGCDWVEFHGLNTLEQVVMRLGNDYGASFEEFLRAEETCFFLVNGKSIMSTGGFSTPLVDTDIVEILPVVEAG